ncbi:MAG: hypothetical protein AAF902_02070 [Chloroflexota bacterium]
MPARTAGTYLNGHLVTLSIDAEPMEGFHTDINDSGPTVTDSTLNDLAGGVDILASNNQGGSMTVTTIVSAGTTEPYKVLDGHLSAGTTFAMVCVGSKGGSSVTWTYAGCIATQVPGPNASAGEASAMLATINIRYATRTVT